jgi:hypothetical protein
MNNEQKQLIQKMTEDGLPILRNYGCMQAKDVADKLEML